MDLCCSSSVNQEINSLLDDLIDQRKDSFMRRWITLSDSDQVAILTHCLLNSESYSSESLHNIIHTLIYHRTLLSDPFQFWDQASRSLVDRILHLLHKPEQHASLTTVQPLQEKVSLHGVLEAIMLMIQQFTKANYSTRDFFVVEIPANSSTHPYFTVFVRRTRRNTSSSARKPEQFLRIFLTAFTSSVLTVATDTPSRSAVAL